MTQIEFQPHTRLDDGLWEVATDRPGEHFYLNILKQWWTYRPETSVVMIVQAVSTFACRVHENNPSVQHGDYACYIAAVPQFLMVANSDDYAWAAWIAEHGCKLTEKAAAVFGPARFAPDGTELEWRP